MTSQSDDEAAPVSPPVPVSFVDNPGAPDVFADEAVGFHVHNGVISITFASARANHLASPGPVSVVVIGRLVLPVSGAQGLAVGLYDFLTKQGLTPKITPKNSN